MPSLVQLAIASAHHDSTLIANQSGKTYLYEFFIAPIQGEDTHREAWPYLADVGAVVGIGYEHVPYGAFRQH